MSDLKQIEKFVEDFINNNKIPVEIRELLIKENNDIVEHNAKIMLEIERLQNEFQKQHFVKCVIFMVIIILGMIITYFTD